MYGVELPGPVLLPREMPRTRAPQHRVERIAARGRVVRARLREDNPHVTVTKLRFSNVLGDDIDDAVLERAAAAGRARDLRLRPAPPVHPRGRRHRRAHVRDDRRRARDLQRRRRRRAALERGLRASCGKRRASRSRRSSPTWAAEPLRVAATVDLPPEVLSLLRYGRGVDNSRFKRTGFRYQYTTAGTVDAFARSLRLERRGRRRTDPAYRTSATSRRSSGTRPPSCAADT